MLNVYAGRQDYVHISKHVKFKIYLQLVKCHALVRYCGALVMNLLLIPSLGAWQIYRDESLISHSRWCT